MAKLLTQKYSNVEHKTSAQRVTTLTLDKNLQKKTFFYTLKTDISKEYANVLKTGIIDDGML